MEEEDEDDWFALELQADRATLNLLAISCLITAPWILLYLDSDVAYGKKPPAYGVCLVQAGFVMGWAVTLAAGALGVVMKVRYGPTASRKYARSPSNHDPCRCGYELRDSTRA